VGNVTIKIGDGATLSIDPYAFKEELSDEDLLKLAKGLCWGEVMKVAAARLAGESEDCEGWGSSDYGDQRTRVEFLAAVESQACVEFVAEVASLKADLARVREEGERMFRALGGGGEFIELHSSACDIRFGREAVGSIPSSDI